MTRIEIETITEAMVTKQTWIRKEMQKFLDAWADISAKDIDGFKFLEIKNTNAEFPDSIYLRRGENRLFFNPAYEAFGDSENHYDLNPNNHPDINTVALREVIELIPRRLTAYFQRMQAKIDAYSEAGQELNHIVNCLTK